ncbi:hypothetical protein B0J13DRAFT_181900 [Dactylonectria estremocensis]|uniref:Uncharacterized protein n=1 Tax=Dactylonectria estremocensis TaxID=1079267 RepID=A0A9P9FDI0_9HYPO|nr:hypothetical protein B0J13DRAFT_181900 [Dactylonectria estremocensis]
MSNKITDARIRELETGQTRKEKLSESLKKQRKGMQDILDSISAESWESMCAASKAAKANRRKESLNLNHEDQIESYTLASGRVEEVHSYVKKELEPLRKLMK